MSDLGVQRFKAHGGEGRNRVDGSEFAALTDREAFAAEEWACRCFGKEPDRTIGRNDNGWDLVLTIDVKHLGLWPDGEPRRSGHLIVNPGKVRADRFVVVSGRSDVGFRYEGYATAKDLLSRPMKDFGFGAKHAVPISELRGRP